MRTSNQRLLFFCVAMMLMLLCGCSNEDKNSTDTDAPVLNSISILSTEGTEISQEETGWFPLPEVCTIPDDSIMPRISLFDDTASSRNGGWTSYEFSATVSNGNYIRFWHQNNTGEKVKVYLYRTDKSTTSYVSMMEVEANDQNFKVYYNATAGSGTYKIVVEPYVSGGKVSGDVAAAQYKTNPNY